MIERYYLKADHETDWSNVTRKQFIAAEQAAGFRSKFGDNHPATSGFSGHGMSGRVEYVEQDECSQLSNKPPAPRAGERERVILNSDLVVRPMPNTLLKTKCLLATDDGWPVAEFYREEEAEGIAHEHNQHATLVAQREQLMGVLSMIICNGCHNRIGWNETPTKYGDWTKCTSCRAAREILATIEQEGEA